MAHETRRWAAAGALLIMPAAFMILWIMSGADLPDRVPTHFDASGTADQFVAAVTYTVTVAVVLAIATILGLIAIAASWTGERFWLAGAGMMQGILVSAWLVSAVVARTGTEDLGGWVALILVSAAWGAVPAFIHPPSQPRRMHASDGAAVPSAPAVPAEPWSDTVTSPLIAAIAVMTAVVLAVMLILIPGEGAVMLIAALLLAPVILILAGLAKYRVSIDERGLRISSVYVGFPLRTFPLEDIARASAGELVPAQWGGWGWRFLPGRSAIVVRRGPALMIERASGSEFAVSLPSADDAAPVLRAYMAGRVSGA